MMNHNDHNLNSSFDDLLDQALARLHAAEPISSILADYPNEASIEYCSNDKGLNTD